MGVAAVRPLAQSQFLDPGGNDGVTVVMVFCPMGPLSLSDPASGPQSLEMAASVKVTVLPRFVCSHEGDVTIAESCLARGW